MRIDPNDSVYFVCLNDCMPDLVYEIRYYHAYNFIGERVEGYHAPLALLTREAYIALKEADADFRSKGYIMKIYDAYRPQKAVDHFVRWAADLNDIRMKAVFYPKINKKDLFAQGYIAEHSSHTRGSTLDLTLCDIHTLENLDMGGFFDDFSEISHPDYHLITEEQYRNRMILRNTMKKHGFEGIDTEWWHFTLLNEPYPDTYFTFEIKNKA